jgi:hypothetical protein
MFLTSPYIDQAIALKFRLLSIQFTSEAFVSSRKMSVIEIYRQLSLRCTQWRSRRTATGDQAPPSVRTRMWSGVAQAALGLHIR